MHSHWKVGKAYFAESNASRCFYAKFFGMDTAEASVLDPQVLLLLETTHKAPELSGQTIVGLKDPDTVIYVAQMIADCESIMLHNPELMGKYHPTGTLTGTSARTDRIVPIHYVSTASVGTIVAAATPDGDAFLFDPVSVAPHMRQLSLSPVSKLAAGTCL
ncbi:hypothetical protein F5B21DRAFT_505834 [Xylaria acuta]|nr:hypothetical protein F5B21DRAFT_505834 [Xylaria acuta]